jgi:hypothetical protein
MHTPVATLPVRIIGSPSSSRLLAHQRDFRLRAAPASWSARSRCDRSYRSEAALRRGSRPIADVLFGMLPFVLGPKRSSTYSIKESQCRLSRNQPLLLLSVGTLKRGGFMTTTWAVAFSASHLLRLAGVMPPFGDRGAIGFPGLSRSRR